MPAPRLLVPLLALLALGCSSAARATLDAPQATTPFLLRAQITEGEVTHPTERVRLRGRVDAFEVEGDPRLLRLSVAGGTRRLQVTLPRVAEPVEIGLEPGREVRVDLLLSPGEDRLLVRDAHTKALLLLAGATRYADRFPTRAADWRAPGDLPVRRAALPEHVRTEGDVDDCFTLSQHYALETTTAGRVTRILPGATAPVEAAGARLALHNLDTWWVRRSTCGARSGAGVAITAWPLAPPDAPAAEGARGGSDPPGVGPEHDLVDLQVQPGLVPAITDQPASQRGGIQASPGR